MTGRALLLLSLCGACGTSASLVGPDPAGAEPYGGLSDDGRSTGGSGSGNGSSLGSSFGSAAGSAVVDAPIPGVTTPPVVVAPPPNGIGAPVDLGTAGTYVILTKAGISTVPTSVITGNIGVSPAAAGSITGFPLLPSATNVFSTTPQVVGKVYAADYAVPTPANLTTAILDMQTAYVAAAALTPDVIELGAGDIGGLTLAPGVYSWSSGLLVPTNVTLAGRANDVWIFQVAQTLTMSTGTKVVLSGGALPRNIFWQVAGAVALGTGAHLNGVILAKTAVTLGTGATINGRLLAQTAVTLASSTILQPAL